MKFNKHSKDCFKPDSICLSACFWFCIFLGQTLWSVPLDSGPMQPGTLFVTAFWSWGTLMEWSLGQFAEKEAWDVMWRSKFGQIVLAWGLKPLLWKSCSLTENICDIQSSEIELFISSCELRFNSFNDNSKGLRFIPRMVGASELDASARVMLQQNHQPTILCQELFPYFCLALMFLIINMKSLSLTSWYPDASRTSWYWPDAPFSQSFPGRTWQNVGRQKTGLLWSSICSKSSGLSFPRH